MKKTITKELKFIGRKSFGAFIFVAVAGTSLWALATFTEPTSGPAASIQDFTTNALGANNADNAFDSSTVSANADGSVLERLEALENKSSGVTAISEKTSSSLTFSAAAQYCIDLSASAEYASTGSNTIDLYTDWRLGSFEEYGIFTGKLADTSYVWTSTAREGVLGQYLIVVISSGNYYAANYTSGVDVRCVR